MKKSLNNVLLYFVYLAVLFIIMLIVISVDFFGGGISISFSNIYNFVDIYSMLIILIFSFAITFLTGLIGDFKNSFLVLAGNKSLSKKLIKKSILSVKVFMVSAIIGGGISAVIQLINIMKSMDGFEYIGIGICLALVSIFYSLIICAVLIPIYVNLKNEIDSEKN